MEGHFPAAGLKPGPKLTQPVRRSGILLHISSLPSDLGLGDFGQQAYRFADYLESAGQTCWQILPLNPTTQRHYHSPYSCSSAFALNPLFIDPGQLADQGLISKRPAPPWSGACPISDYQYAAKLKTKIIDEAWNNFSPSSHGPYHKFCQNNYWWLDDYALFATIKTHISSLPWNQWPPDLRDRNPKTLKQLSSQYSRQIEKEGFVQFILYRQWHNLKQYCNHKNIKIIGDMPIYLSGDSAEVWSHPHFFKLDPQGQPTQVAGVPPDYFCSQGQLWGNPVYRWDRLKGDRYQWLIDRFTHNFKLFDITRIDHFRGLVSYWEIPASEKNAVKGTWVKAPVYDFLDTLISRQGSLPIIAEDLGYITDDVREVLKHYGFANMKILLFAFGQDNHPYLPHHYPPHCYVYTGTHDNNTAVGWFKHEALPSERARLSRYTGKRINSLNVNWELIRLAMQSVASTCIIPMQDVLGLDSQARMNLPATLGTNWKWALGPDYGEDKKTKDKLAYFTETYGR